MRTNEKFTASQGPISVKLEESKGRFNWGLDVAGIVISAVTLIAVTSVGVFTFLLDERVEETKQLNRYLDKVGEIISDHSTTKYIDEKQQELSFNFKYITQISNLNRIYLKFFNKKNRGNVIIYLYEYDLIDRSKTTGKEWSGQVGICKEHEDRVDIGNKLKRGEDIQTKPFTYCNVSTYGYYFGDVDMSHETLRDIKLNDSYLEGANFTKADLKGAEFKVSKLRAANFTDADLKGVDFIWADLSEANLKGADLSRFIDKEKEWREKNIN